MKKNLLLICLVVFIVKVNSQVGINTNNPSSTFDVTVKRNQSGVVSDNTENYGVKLPTLSRLELSQNTATYGVNQKGAMIYINNVSTGAASGQLINVDSVGYYYFDGSVWKKLQSKVSNTINISTVVNPNVLGYVPSTSATAGTSPTTSTTLISGTTLTRTGFTTYSVNGHSYAAYVADRIITWYEAYNAARTLGGYLATFTNDAEWIHVDTTLLNTSTNYTNYSGWIGFAKYNWNAGASLVPNPEMKWITGEQPYHDYSVGGTTSVKKSNWFKSGEPNNSGGNEGFVHFYRSSAGNTVTSSSHSSTHPWNDVPANNTGEVVRAFIVEFQQ